MKRIFLSAFLFSLFLGILDTLDIILGGYAPALSGAGFGLLFLSNILPLAALSSWIVAGWYGCTILWQKSALPQPSEQIEFYGQAIFTRHQFLSLWVAGYAGYIFVSFGVIIDSLSGPETMRIPSIRFAILATLSGIGGALFLWTLIKTNRRTLILPIAAVLITLQIYYLSRLLYIFSRLGGPLSFLHGTALCLLVIFVLGLVGAYRPQTRDPVASKYMLLAVVVVLTGSVFANCLLDQTSHTMRLLVQERSSFAFRALRILPDCHLTDSPLREYSKHCATPSPDTKPQINTGSPATDYQAPESLSGVVVLMVDTLRADRLNLKRDGQWLTPNLRHIAGKSTSFEQMYSNTPSTHSFLQILSTGRYTTKTQNIEGQSTLSDILHNHAIKTTTVSAHTNLEDMFGKSDIYDDRFVTKNLPEGKNAKTSPMITQTALSYLTERPDNQPFFTLIHYYDPHSHYVKNGMFDFGWSEVDRYDAEVAYTDHWIGKFVEALQKNGLWDKIALVIVSDHGEEFLDHKYERHQVRLYNESNHAVFMAHLPGQTSGRSISSPVSTVDLLPTFLDLYGLPMPDGLQGHSLAPAMDGRPMPPATPVYLHSNNHAEKLGLIEGHYKLIINQHIGVLELYDLQADPRELVNLADDDPSRTQSMFCKLKAWADQEKIWWN